MEKEKILKEIEGGLIVSCQALPGEPLQGAQIMAKMALAAKQGGAVGIRANGFEDIVAIKEEVDLPVIGIVKKNYEGNEIHITPTMNEVKLVYDSGAEIVALDATTRPRPDGMNLGDLVLEIRKTYPSLILMADVSNFEEGLEAEKLGFDLIGTTLSGYTPYSRASEDPDYELMKDLVHRLSTPIIAEGKINSPEQLELAMNTGVFAAVVGSSITRPQEITKRFAQAVRRNNK